MEKGHCTNRPLQPLCPASLPKSCRHGKASCDCDLPEATVRRPPISQPSLLDLSGWMQGVQQQVALISVTQHATQDIMVPHKRTTVGRVLDGPDVGMLQHGRQCAAGRNPSQRCLGSNALYSMAADSLKVPV